MRPYGDFDHSQAQEQRECCLPGAKLTKISRRWTKTATSIISQLPQQSSLDNQKMKTPHHLHLHLSPQNPPRYVMTGSHHFIHRHHPLRQQREALQCSYLFNCSLPRESSPPAPPLQNSSPHQHPLPFRTGPHPLRRIQSRQYLPGLMVSHDQFSSRANPVPPLMTLKPPYYQPSLLEWKSGW